MFFFLLFFCVTLWALHALELKRESWSFLGAKKEEEEEVKEQKDLVALLFTFFFFFLLLFPFQKNTSRNIPFFERDGSSSSGSKVRGAALLRRLGLFGDRAGRGRRRKGVVGDPEPVRRRRS